MEFFRKYGAVPATDSGPNWSQASNDSLFYWAKEDCRLWDGNPAAHHGLVDRMQDIGNELHRRFLRDKASPEIAAQQVCLMHRIFERIGYGRREKNG